MTKEKLDELINVGATRKCSRCNQMLPVSQFHIRADKNPNHYRFNSPCKSCAHVGRNIDYHKAYQRKIKYNLTQEEYDLMLKKQNYSCEICGIHKDDCTKELCVDHCHKTGKVRSLLCNNCNSGIGFFNESERVMKKAIEYLKNT